MFFHRYMLTRYEQVVRRYRELSRQHASLSANDSLRSGGGGVEERNSGGGGRNAVSAGTDQVTASLSSSRHLQSRRIHLQPPPPAYQRHHPPLRPSQGRLTLTPQEVPLPPSNNSELLERLGELRRYIQGAWVQAMMEIGRGVPTAEEPSVEAHFARLMAEIPGGGGAAAGRRQSPLDHRADSAARLADVLVSGLRRLREINRQLRTLELGSLASRNTGLSNSSLSSVPTPTLEYNTLRMVEQILLRRIEEQEQVIESEIQRVRQFNSRIFSSPRNSSDTQPTFSSAGREPANDHQGYSADTISHSEGQSPSSRSQMGNLIGELMVRRAVARLNQIGRYSTNQGGGEDEQQTPQRRSTRQEMGNLFREFVERRPVPRLNQVGGRPSDQGGLEDEATPQRRWRREEVRLTDYVTDGASATGPATSDPLDISHIRLGMQLLSYHIDNMSRLNRVRFEMVQLRQVRQMWDDLQRSLGELQSAVSGEGVGGGGSAGETTTATTTTTASGSWRPHRTDTTNLSSPTPQRRNWGSSPGWYGGRMTGTSSFGETSDSSSVGTSDSFHTPRRLRSLLTDVLPVSPHTPTATAHSGPGLQQQTPGTSGAPPPAAASTSTAGTSSSGVDSEGDCSSGSSSRPPLLSFRRSARSSASKRARFEAAIRSTPRLYRYRSSRIAEMFYRQARSTATTDEGSDDDNNQGGNTSSSNNGGGAVVAAIISQSRRKRTRPSPPSCLQTISSHQDGGRQVGNRSNNSYQMPRLRAGCTRFNRHRTSPSFLPQRIIHRPPSAFYSYNRNSNNSTRDISSQTPPFLIDASVGTDPDMDELELGTSTGRLRARQALLQMIESLMDFLENDTMTRNLPPDVLHRRIICLYNLLQRALELTQTLIQMIPPRTGRGGSGEGSRSGGGAASGGSVPREELATASSSSLPSHQEGGRSDRSDNRLDPPSPELLLLSDLSEPTRRFPPSRRSIASLNINSSTSSPPSSSSSGSESTRRIPTLRVNDMPMPVDYVIVPSRRVSGNAWTYDFPPSSSSSDLLGVEGEGGGGPPLAASAPPPPPPPAPRLRRLTHQHHHRMFRLSPVDDSGDDSSPAPVVIDSSFYVRWISDHNTGLTHRIQAWDFTKCSIPQISNSQMNVVVQECRVHNDASVDISKDGKLLVALLPSVSMGPSGNTNMLGIYSLEWGTLGQCLYRTVCLQNAVSVSLSPTSRHLVVGLASRRSLITLNFPQYLAQVCKLNGGEARIGGEKTGNLMFVREIKLPAESETISVNCIRWIPSPGSGFVYGTNTGQLKILR